MRELKIEWAHKAQLLAEQPSLHPFFAPVVRLDELTRWLRSHRVAPPMDRCAENSLIQDLLAELTARKEQGHSTGHASAIAQGMTENSSSSSSSLKEIHREGNGSRKEPA